MLVTKYIGELYHALPTTVFLISVNFSERVAEDDPRRSILSVLRDIMNRLEYFVDANAFEGNIDKFYRLLDYVSHHRPVS